MTVPTVSAKQLARTAAQLKREPVGEILRIPRVDFFDLSVLHRFLSLYIC